MLCKEDKQDCRAKEQDKLNEKAKFLKGEEEREKRRKDMWDVEHDYSKFH